MRRAAIVVALDTGAIIALARGSWLAGVVALMLAQIALTVRAR